MPTIRSAAALILTAALTAVSTTAAAWGPGVQRPGASTNASLSKAEIATLQYMREEEKLARDAYLTFYGIYGRDVFANIMEAEQKHFDAVGDLMAKYGVEDPAAQDRHGYFVNPDLQELYDRLTAAGATDLLSALYVGGLIEETDMGDLANAMDESDQRDLDRVYDNLREGSKNHLRAFVYNVEATGASYEPQYLTEDEVERILEEGSTGPTRM